MAKHCYLVRCGRRIFGDMTEELVSIVIEEKERMFCCRSHALRWLLRNCFLGGVNNTFVQEIEPRIVRYLED